MQYLQNLFHQIVARISGFFRKLPEFKLDREPFSAPRLVKKRKPRDPTSKNNLSSLLDHLDKTFKVMRLPTHRMSWCSRDTIIGLKRLGPHVPDPWLMKFDKNPEKVLIELGRRFPAIMCISFSNDGGEDSEGLRPPTTMYGIRQEKLPAHVRQIPGVVYEYGLTYIFEGKQFWIQCHIIIDPKTGKVVICDELTNIWHTLPPKAGRRGEGGARQYMTRKWQPPSLLTNDRLTMDQSRIVIMNFFRAMVLWWRGRELCWSVSVRKGRDRVTFSVAQENTKIYFADRDKTVKAADGKAKKIIHHVRQHERVTANKITNVREHIRGIREFDWSGYRCVITAPKFHLTHLSSEFDVPPTEIDPTKEGWVNAAELGKILAQHEETDYRKSA